MSRNNNTSESVASREISRTSSSVSLNSGTTFTPGTGAAPSSHSATTSVKKSIKDRLASLICVLLGGEKGASLGEMVIVRGRMVRMVSFGEGDKKKNKKGKGDKENPVARLKLLLVGGHLFILKVMLNFFIFW